MHIVFANQWFPPESGRGGVAMYNHAMARALRDVGHQVTVIAARHTPDTPADVETDGFRVRRLLVRDADRWRRMPGMGRYVRPAQQLMYSRRVDQAIRQLHREQPVDVVEFAEVNAEGFFYALAPETPFVVRCHTPTFVLARYYDRLEMPYDTSIITACEKSLIRRAHALTTPSQDLARVIAHECQVPIHSISVIPNALYIDNTMPPTDNLSNEKITVLYVGRLERAKGVTVLADAIPHVARQVPNMRFILVGDDRPTARGTSQRAELDRQLEITSTHPHVRLLGGLPQKVLMDWYYRADICVVPSLLYESFSYTCAQAMAAGKPVIASRIGGIPETIEDGVTGLLVQPGNVDELADAIVRLACDSNLRKRLGRAGREKAEREFDAIKIAEKNLKVYEQSQKMFQSSRRV